jgi:hypothetical protein
MWRVAIPIALSVPAKTATPVCQFVASSIPGAHAAKYFFKIKIHSFEAEA